MAKSIFTERALWLAFAVLFFFLSTAMTYVWNGLQTAQQSVDRLESQSKTNKVQWEKISLMREDYWKAQVAQAYRNGCMETAIKYINKGEKF